MDKKNKGLVDDNEHGIILNESGTSVSFGWDAEGENADTGGTATQENNDEATIQPSSKTDESTLSGGE